MKIRFAVLVSLLAFGLCRTAHGGFFDLFKRKLDAVQTNGLPTLPAGLTEDQVIGGLKEALGRGVTQAVTTLGKEDGFLKDLAVKVPMPDGLVKAEKALRNLGQNQLADDFVTAMNRAAEQAVPQAASVLGDAVKQMSIADAKSILLGTNNAATQYFRRTSETNLQARLLPIVKGATEQAGVTAAYKRMVDKVSGGISSFGLGGLGGNFLGIQAPDLDSYITSKALDGLFVKIADQEKQIRADPVARTTDLLQRVFGTVKNNRPAD